MTSIIHAILSINPEAKVSVNAEDFEQIIWHDGTTPISKADIEAKMAELQADYDSQEYARNRAAAYPSLQEFAEAYCEKEIGGSSTKWDAYKTAYNKVRTDNPKE